MPQSCVSPPRGGYAISASTVCYGVASSPRQLHPCRPELRRSARGVRALLSFVGKVHVAHCDACLCFEGLWRLCQALFCGIFNCHSHCHSYCGCFYVTVCLLCEGQPSLDGYREGGTGAWWCMAPDTGICPNPIITSPTDCGNGRRPLYFIQ